MDWFNINIGEIIWQIVDLADNAKDGKDILDGIVSGKENNYVSEKLRDTGQNLEVQCPNCSKKFFYWIKNEKIEKINKLEPVDIITTCPFCKKTCSSFFKLKNDNCN